MGFVGQIVSGSIRGLRFLDVPTVPAEVLGLGRLSFTGFSWLSVFTSCAGPLWGPISGRGGKSPPVVPEGFHGGNFWVCFWVCLLFVILFVKPKPFLIISE